MYCAKNVRLLQVAFARLEDKTDAAIFRKLQYASEQRAAIALATQWRRRIGFDVCKSCALGPYELVNAPFRMPPTSRLALSKGASQILRLLPHNLTTKPSNLPNKDKLAQVCLDYGQRVVARVDGRRI